MRRSTKRRIGTAYVLAGLGVWFIGGPVLNITGPLIVLCGLLLFYV